jgi:fumarate reductase flavoprotein subunit
MTSGHDADFLRHESLAAKGAPTTLEPIEQGPFYAVRMLPAELVCTHTGLQVDDHTRVLDHTGKAVPGLYAAGEAAGGILGNRYVGGGNSVAHALVLGRRAGRESAAQAALLHTSSADAEVPA